MGLWRFLIRRRPNVPDPEGAQVLHLLRDFGISTVESARSGKLFLIELDDNGRPQKDLSSLIASDLLTDPVTEEYQIRQHGDVLPEPADCLAFEVHYRPGVTDNEGQSTLLALRNMGIHAVSVRTARRYELSPIPRQADLPRIKRLLGNDCIEEVVVGTRPILPPAKPPIAEFIVRQVSLRQLDDESLKRLSADGHLFLSLDEMKAIQGHYKTAGREPTDVELETLAQTWSEHCVHKTLKSAVTYRGSPMPNSQATEVRYANLLRDTIARATEELMREGRGPECLSVFKDNAGIIGFDNQYAVAIKVETHNHPSAIEPYGGAATGVGGVIRDVLGCGLGAQPIASTDVFCVAPPDWPVDAVPKGVIHPRAVLKGVVAGVRDYGNRMGIPTVNGALHTDPRYLGNPLVYCGCVGLIPRDRIEKQVRPGDLIVLMGGRTGRDGIHGATFSSAELTDTHEDEFAHAVQIGNAIEEKKLLDVIIQARDGAIGDGPASAKRGPCLYSALTDCGAGGLSSAVGEMAADCGADVDLEMVPLKYVGLRYDEIWISEAQERMVLAVPPQNWDRLAALAKSEDVETTIIGRFTNSGRLIVRYSGTQVGDLDLKFLHDGLPKTTRTAEWSARPVKSPSKSIDAVVELKRRLSSPIIASKHWLIRQYDHEVGGRSVVKPLVGRHDGPSDAAIIRPRLDSNRGIAIGCGLAPELGDVDPYWMAVAAIDEALRNVVSVGGDPSRTAILDNFCWPRVDDPQNMGALVRACQACYDTAKAYGLPFISGKDSLNNEFALDEADVEMVRRAAGADIVRMGRLAIPYTLLISAISLVEDVDRCITASLKQDDAKLFLIGSPAKWSASSFDFATARRTHQTVARMIQGEFLWAVHDVSDGGLLVALAEMCIASRRMCRVDDLGEWAEFCFDSMPACYLVEVANNRMEDFKKTADGVTATLVAEIGTSATPFFGFADPTDARKTHRISLDDLSHAWRTPLDW